MNKIPPPVLMLFALMAIWALNKYTSFAPITFKGQTALAAIIAFCGVALMISAGYLFKKNQTTIHPFSPQNTSAIVTQGVYRISRNPMYLAMLFILMSSVVLYGKVIALAPVLIFFIYMTRHQIIPEERALETKFGQTYLDYKAKVRRWI